MRNKLPWNVLLFSCNLIGQLCVSGPVYSSHNVTCELFDTISTTFNLDKITPAYKGNLH